MPQQDRLIYLASASPRRRSLLEQIGVRCQILKVAVDEAALPAESPEVMVCRLALAKARAGRDLPGERTPLPVLGADTAVVADHVIMGKPQHREDALRMLRLLSGRVHHVYTGVALVRDAEEACRLSVSAVSFREMTDAECERYWESGEPTGKAGAYAIQGQAAVFVARLEGSYSGVMGLPLYETAELLRQFDVIK